MTIRIPNSADSGEDIILDQTTITGFGNATDAELAQLGVTRSLRVTAGGVNYFTSYTQQELESAINAANAVGVPTIVACGAFNPATGALLGGFGFASGAKNATGDYTVTLSAAPPAGSLALVSSQSGGPEIVATDGPLALTQDIKSFDAAGVAADAGFVVLVVRGPA